MSTIDIIVLYVYVISISYLVRAHGYTHVSLSISLNMKPSYVNIIFESVDAKDDPGTKRMTTCIMAVDP